MRASLILTVGFLAYACSEPEPDGRSPSLSETRAEARPEAPRERDGMLESSLYVAPIPDGFERSPAQPSALIASERRPRAESFLSSILVHSIPYPDPSERKDLSDPARCEADASGIVEILSSQEGPEPTGFETEIIELPVGRSCRYRFNLAGDTPQTTQGTVLQSDRGDFMVVCNIAEGDALGRAGCDAFVRGWRWRGR